MTRIFVQRGSSAGASSSSCSSSNPSRSSSSSSAPRNEPSSPSVEESLDQAVVRELVECSKIDDENETSPEGISATEAVGTDNTCAELPKGFGVLRLTEKGPVEATDLNMSPMPPPPPVPPPKPCAFNSNPRRLVSGSSNTTRIGPSRRPLVAWPVISTRTSPTGSRPSSPRSHSECEGYNSADEQSPCFVSSYDDVERERQFEIEIRRAKGLEVKKMVEDGNCLFRGVADQVYGDSESYDLARQMCIDYMERERDHFSQFITEGFTTYCKRKRRDKVYGNNVEIQALSEMFNRPIHIYSYSTEPINIFHGSYDTDSPPIRLSYHHGNHYNSLVDPRRVTIGAGLGFSCLGANVDKEKIKAAIAAQQDEQIENALVAEGRLYSDIELTEKEIERMVVAISRAEYIVGEGDNERKLRQQQNQWSSSSSNNVNNQPSSSSSSSSSSNNSSVVSLVVSMGFNYLQVMEAYSLFGEDADSIVCYLLETTATRRKGKAAES